MAFGKNKCLHPPFNDNNTFSDHHFYRLQNCPRTCSELSNLEPQCHLLLSVAVELALMLCFHLCIELATSIRLIADGDPNASFVFSIHPGR